MVTQQEQWKLALLFHSRGSSLFIILYTGAHTALDTETERIVVQYLLYMADCGMALTRKLFSIMVKCVITKFHLTTPFTDDTPSYRWMRNFPKRHNVVALIIPGTRPCQD